MRKLVSLILGCIIAYYLYINWQNIINLLGKNLSIILLIYVVALGVIHIGGILLKILAVLFVMLEPLADKYCYWYENTKFYKFLHKDEVR